MRHHTVAGAAAIAIVSGATVGADAPTAEAQSALPAASALIRSAFAHPNTAPPAAPPTFRPAVSHNLFTARLLAGVQPQQKPAMQGYAEQMNQMVASAYAEYGFAPNDLGAAFGAFLETSWEISTGTFKTEAASAQDKARTRAAVYQMQNALLASPEYKATSDENKQLLYEACTFMTGSLATQWLQAGGDATRKAGVQAAARKQLLTIFGIAPESLTRRPDGAFVGARGLTANPGVGAGAAVPQSAPTAGGRRPLVTAPTSAAATTGPLPAAHDPGARIFVKYVFQATKTSFDQLILFPDGAAFTDLPRAPIARFNEASLRASLKPYDVGTWKEAGDTLVLTFPNKQREPVTTLRRVQRGWYDGTGAVEANSSYNTYFPVVPLTPTQLAGAWHSESLTTMGFAGGAAPVVAHGSSSDRVFNANGTFAEGSSAFTSATTDSTGVYGTNDKKGVGRWRLDGPLITLESAGRRTVTLAFVLPHWNKTGPPELLINGEWWQRPEKKR